MKDEQIIQRLHLEALPEDVQQQMLASVSQTVELRLMGVMEDLMTDQQKQEFENLEKGSPEAVWQWLSDNLADVASTYESLLGDYIEEVNSQTRAQLGGIKKQSD